MNFEPAAPAAPDNLASPKEQISLGEQISPGEQVFPPDARFKISLDALLNGGAIDCPTHRAGLKAFGILPGLDAWKAFSSYLALLLGVIFCLCGVIFFFAWNWHAMPRLLKIGLALALVPGFGLAGLLTHGRRSNAVFGLGLGVSLGVALAVLGQVYQGGAGEVALLFTWAAALLPLLFIFGGSGLFLLTWLVGSAGYALWLLPLGGRTFLFLFCAAQLAALVLWELAQGLKKFRKPGQAALTQAESGQRESGQTESGQTEFARAEFGQTGFAGAEAKGRVWPRQDGAGAAWVGSLLSFVVLFSASAQVIFYMDAQALAFYGILFAVCFFFYLRVKPDLFPLIIALTSLACIILWRCGISWLETDTELLALFKLALLLLGVCYVIQLVGRCLRNSLQAREYSRASRAAPAQGDDAAKSGGKAPGEAQPLRQAENVYKMPDEQVLDWREAFAEEAEDAGQATTSFTRRCLVGEAISASMPWYVHAWQLVVSWLCVADFVAVFGLFFGSSGAAVALVLGLAMLVGGVCAARSGGLFRQHLGAAMVFWGSLPFAAFCYLSGSNIWFTCLLYFTVAFFAVPLFAARCGLALGMMFCFYSGLHNLISWDITLASVMYYALSAHCAAALLVCAFWPALCVRGLKKYLVPAAIGAVLYVAEIQFFVLFDELLSIVFRMQPYIHPAIMGWIFLAVMALHELFRLKKAANSPAPQPRRYDSLLFFAACAALAVGFYFVPRLAFALLLLVLARNSGSRAALVVAGLYLGLHIFFWYYNLQVTLLVKSFCLLGGGAVLLLLFFGLSFTAKPSGPAFSGPAPSGGLPSGAAPSGPAPIGAWLRRFGAGGAKPGLAPAKACQTPARALSRRFWAIALGLFLAVFSALFLYTALQKEVTIRNGRAIALQLAPRDPRSLMQGDYMRLEFAIAPEIEDIAAAVEDNAPEGRSYLPQRILLRLAPLPGKGLPNLYGNPVLGLQAAGQPANRAAGQTEDQPANMAADRATEKLPENPGAATEPGAEDILLLCKVDYDGNVVIAGGAFFFQEGTGHIYEAARYAELKVNRRGEAIITRLLDADGKALGPGENP